MTSFLNNNVPIVYVLLEKICIMKAGARRGVSSVELITIGERKGCKSGFFFIWVLYCLHC